MPTSDRTRVDIALQKALKARNETVWHPCGTKHDSQDIKRDTLENAPLLSNSFQIDKERIALCKAFRRLKHKTQLFWAPRNDHFRTRLTHTLEVTFTARQLGALLGLNTDLIEAISYGLDIGYPPFGTAGVRAVREWLEKYKHHQAELAVSEQDPEYRANTQNLQYDQHFWSWKILQRLETHPSSASQARGLNLTNKTQEGIRDPTLGNLNLLEAQVVFVAERLSWIDHDYQELTTSGLALPPDITHSIRSLGSTKEDRRRTVIDDVVCHSLDLGDNECKTLQMSTSLADLLQTIAKAQTTSYARDDRWRRHEEGARIIIHHLLDWYLNAESSDIQTTIRRLTGDASASDDGISFLRRWQEEGTPRVEASLDHVVKMSDTFALDLYRRLYSPEVIDYYF